MEKVTIKDIILRYNQGTPAHKILVANTYITDAKIVIESNYTEIQKNTASRQFRRMVVYRFLCCGKMMPPAVAGNLMVYLKDKHTECYDCRRKHKANGKSDYERPEPPDNSWFSLLDKHMPVSKMDIKPGTPGNIRGKVGQNDRSHN